MAGRGRAPKNPDHRARRNVDAIPTTKLKFVREKQPPLPPRMPGGRAWPPRTRAWWRRWARDPRADRFDAAAWDELLDTAVVHANLWHGDVKAASELRLRTAKFGVTPEDRARLRIQMDDGLEGAVGGERGEQAKEAKTPAARERYRGLRVVNGATPAPPAD